MLVLISANSVQSQWVEAELTYGLFKAASIGGKLVPVLIPPKAALPHALAHIQALDMTGDIDQGIESYYINFSTAGSFTVNVGRWTPPSP